MQDVSVRAQCRLAVPQCSSRPCHNQRPAALTQPPRWRLQPGTNKRDVTTRFVPTTRPDAIEAPEVRRQRICRLSFTFVQGRTVA
jgi:hypothetical protein